MSTTAHGALIARNGDDCGLAQGDVLRDVPLYWTTEDLDARAVGSL